MSIQLFDETTVACSRLITRRYSTSFSLGIQMLGASYRNPIYAIYGFVRFADEIVDTFHQHDKKQLLQAFETQTWDAISKGISLNPVLHSFQKVVNTYHIHPDLIHAFWDSMRMDLEYKKYDSVAYKKYIYGSAEGVGLMCLSVFCNGNAAMYEALNDHARSLGAAFQKVNFLRDMGDDFSDKGRVYFPNVDFSNFNASTKKCIEEEIQKDFDHALEGIKKLPDGSKIGVYLAYKYYLKLFKKIKATQPSQIMQERIRINNARKVSILLRSLARYKLNLF